MKKLPTYDSLQQIISENNDDNIEQIINRTNRIINDSKENRRNAKKTISTMLELSSN